MSLQHIISGKGRERPFPEGFAEVTLFNSNEYSLFYAKDDLNHRLLVDSLKKEKRDLSDLQRIYEIVNGLEFFKNILADLDSSENSELWIKLCSSIKYECISMGKFVFRQNDPSNDKFYVILSGEVGIITQADYSNIYEKDKEAYERTARLTNIRRTQTPKPVITTNNLTSHEMKNRFTFNDDEINASIEHEKESLSNTRILDSARTPKRNTILLSNFGEKFLSPPKFLREKPSTSQNFFKRRGDEKKAQDRIDEDEREVENEQFTFEKLASRFGNLARILGKGAEFGDAALKEPGKKRTASILCQTDCEFLVLDSQAYNDFVKRKSEIKNEFLLKCFSFLSSVSSSQVKSRITYSFISEGYAYGHILMDENVVVTNPKLCLIESGQCKIQKKYVVRIRNPYQKDQLIKEEVHWLTICTVGPGTLLGEEVLEYTKPHEHYDYRVTVSSSKLSVLTILKSTFVKIHTEIEDQTRLYYQSKKAQRDEIYTQLKNKFDAKYHPSNMAKVERLLGQSASVASRLNKKALNAFTSRDLKRALDSKRQTNSKSPIEIRAEPSPQWPVNTITENVLITEKESEEVKAVPLSPLKRSATETSLLQPKKLFEMTSTTDLNKSIRFSIVQREVADGAEENRFSVNKTITAANSSPRKLALEKLKVSTPTDICSDESAEKISLKELLIKEARSERKADPRSATSRTDKQSLPKRIRIRRDNNENQMPSNHSLRNSKEEIKQQSYLENIPSGDPISEQAEECKFIFADDKEFRVRTFNKEKQLKKGVPNAAKELNYLLHARPLGSAIKTRITRTKSPQFEENSRVFTNITYFNRSPSPFSDRLNNSLQSQSSFVFSPKAFGNKPPLRSKVQNSVLKELSKPDAYSLNALSPIGDINSQLTFKSRIEDMMLSFEKDEKESIRETSEDASSFSQPFSRVGIANGVQPKRKEPLTKNWLYQNLLLKSSMQKKIRRVNPSKPNCLMNKSVETSTSLLSALQTSSLIRKKKPLNV